MTESGRIRIIEAADDDFFGATFDFDEAVPTEDQEGQGSEQDQNSERKSHNDDAEVEEPNDDTYDGVQGEIFEIEDFTCASSWERFISKLELQFRDWGIHGRCQELQDFQEDLPYGDSGVCIGGCKEFYQFNAFKYGRERYVLELHYVKPVASDNNLPKSPYRCTYKEKRFKGQEYFSVIMRDLVSRKRDHTFDGHKLRKWFGIDTFLILRPETNRTLDESGASMLLSTMALAADNADCAIVQFVPVFEPERELYYGRVASSGTSLRFDIRSQSETPPLFRHLAGIQEHFTSQMERNHSFSMRLGSGLAHTLQSEACRVQIAMSYTFVKNSEEWDFDHEWRDFSRDAQVSYGTRWGPRYSPISSLSLRTSWPFFREGMFIDNAVYSDIDPTSAPNLHISVQWCPTVGDSATDLRRNTPLTYSMQHFLNVVCETKLAERWSEIRTVDDEVIDAATVRADGRNSPFLAVRAFDTLQKALQGDMDMGQTNTRKDENVECPKAKNPFDADVFSESSFDEPLASSSISASSRAAYSKMSNHSEAFAALPTLPFRAAPFGSVLSALVLQLLDLQKSLTVRTLATIWSEFLNEITSRWDSISDIPKINGDSPDLRSCLLHQKLQLLNQCIAWRKKRKQGLDSQNQQGNVSENESLSSVVDSNTSSAIGSLRHSQSSEERSQFSDSPFVSSDTNSKSKSTSSKQDWDSWDWNDEDSDNESGMSDLENLDDLLGDEVLGDEKNDNRAVVVEESQSSKGDVSKTLHFACSCCKDGEITFVAEGAKKPIDNLFLLSHQDRLINEPFTQDHALMTSDMLEEQQKTLEKLGTSREASLVRAELQGSHLLSDMSAFRAANPCCTLSDFIRWYSPNDWIASVDTDSEPDTNTIEEEDSKLSNQYEEGMMSPTLNKNGLAGKLSARMCDPRSLWHRLWKKSTAAPVSKQEPLFDFELEGSKIIQYLLNLSPEETLHQLTQIAFSNCLHVIHRTEGFVDQLEPLNAMFNESLTAIREVGICDSETLPSHSYDGLLVWCDKSLKALETESARAAALLELFGRGTLKRLVESLIRKPKYDSHIIFPDERTAVMSLFTGVDDLNELVSSISPRSNSSDHSQSALGRPICREFTLFGCCPRPSLSSRIVSNRMYVKIHKREFRLSTCFGLSEI